MQEVLYTSDTSFTGTINIKCTRLNAGGDSLLVYRCNTDKLLFKSGAHLLPVQIDAQNKSAWVLPVFGDIVRKTNACPAGSYYITLQLNAKDTQTNSFLYIIDSSLALQSDARRQMDDIYAPQEGKSILGVRLGSGNNSGAADKASKLIKRSSRKIDQAFGSKGITLSHRQSNGKDYTDLWYQNWFIGYYEVDLSKSIKATIENQRKRASADIASLTKVELGNMPTVFSQIRNNKKTTHADKYLTGEIGVGGFISSGQEEYSAQDDNYYELHGRLEAPIMDIPVSVEGFYTSQDRHRQIKASYIRLHYDVEKSKQELMDLISGYKSKYEQAKATGSGLDGVYGGWLQQLAGQKGRVIDSLKGLTGLDQSALLAIDKEGLKQQIASMIEDSADLKGRLDTTGKLNKTTASATHTKDLAAKRYPEALEKYERIQALQQKIDKYQKLLDQYKNTSYFDSVMAYEKLKNIGDGDEQSYKQLAKKAGDLLPAGKARKMITGLVSLDAGIINKDLSKYTMAGQQVKGLDLQYDLGFCETGFTLGNTEYISRDGNVDKYTCYSGRAMFRPLKGQKATLTYYGYTPSRKMLADESFFKDADVAMPSFRSPVHIVSGAYEGSIKHNLHFETEIAASLKKHEPEGISLGDKMAWSIKLDGAIPRTPLTMEGSYEHAGVSFENNSLPVSMSGTDRYRLAGKADLFHSFLSLGVEYNYLLQQSFSSTGGNSRWGFEIGTHSKRYPSVTLSYKPFTTFRSYSDTMAIPQRPLTGEVWAARISYQLKRKGYCLRFTGSYNKNSSEMDTMSYGSSMFQLGCIYTKAKLMAMISIGNIAAQSGNAPAANGKTQFINLNGSYVLNARWSVNLGQDFGLAGFGFSKYGANAGCTYNLKKLPLSLRPCFRYLTYRLAGGTPWKNVYGGSIEALWQIKFKLKDDFNK